MCVMGRVTVCRFEMLPPAREDTMLVLPTKVKACVLPICGNLQFLHRLYKQ
jgi:hypothetical protein